MNLVTNMDLQEYIQESDEGIDESLLYKTAALDQMVFVRDMITTLFQTDCWIETTHTSKSIQLPVYSFSYNGQRFQIRGNFYDWCVSVDTNFLHLLPRWMFESLSKGFFEGIDEFDTGDKFCVNDKQRLFAILWWIRNEVLI